MQQQVATDPGNAQSAISPIGAIVLTTPSLLNEAYTRLRALANAYEHACGMKSLAALYSWMTSYGRQLNGMADVLQDHGARRSNDFLESSKRLYDDEVCAAADTLLAEGEVVQKTVLICFESLYNRTDMNYALCDCLANYYGELKMALAQIVTLRASYLAESTD